LDFGQKIFEGTPTEMLASSVVRAAYLGFEAGQGGAELAEAEADLHAAEDAPTA
jgi:hypothetical protein